MEYSEAKEYAREYLNAAVEIYRILKEIEEEGKDPDEKKRWGGDDSDLSDILTDLIESRSMKEFLDNAETAYTEIEEIVSKGKSSGKRDEAIRAYMVTLTKAVLSLLSQMYGSQSYEEIMKVQEVLRLHLHQAFLLAVYQIEEDADFEFITGLTDWVLSGEGNAREEAYECIKKYSTWDFLNGVVPRHLYLKILLRYFHKEDGDAMFVLDINRAISSIRTTGEERDENQIEEDEIDAVINRGFGVLPVDMQQRIVEQCTCRDILCEDKTISYRKDIKDPCPEKVLEPVIRRHVNTMIQNMWCDEDKGVQGEKRRRLKFNCIDCAYASALLRKVVSEESEADIVRDNHDSGNRMSSVFNILFSSVHVMGMSLKEDVITMYVHEKRTEGKTGRQCDKEYTAPFDEQDSELIVLSEILEKNKIPQIVMKYGKDPNNSDFYYSLLYIENYRGIDRITVSFDHLYEFSRNDKNVTLRDDKSEDVINNFYGEKILSITGFVGKNGAGKTSTVDFLRDSFLCICNDLFDEKLHAENGVVEIEPNEMVKYRLKADETGPRGAVQEGTRFFVIFHFNGGFYYLTNIKIRSSGKGETGRNGDAHERDGRFGAILLNNLTKVRPYQIGDMLPMHTRDRRIVYFSQFLGPFDVEETERRSYAEDAAMIDLSEESLNRTRRKLTVGESSRINHALFMQLIFFYYFYNNKKHKKKRLDSYFKENFLLNEIDVKSESLEQLTCDHIDTEKLVSLSGDMISVVVKDPMAYIRPFSSGQYSKFALLSKLFWCIKGWQIFDEVLSERGAAPKDIMEETNDWDAIRDELAGSYLPDADAAVLFFDEADTYYHPDWQRSFVWDIWKMINEYRDNPVQVVFTTNSPLMLSDLMQRDVYLMKNPANEMHEGRASVRAGALKGRNPSIQTFGQNIHTLLAKPFFLERTIGVFADKRIEWLVGILIDVTEIVEFLDDLDAEDAIKESFAEQLRDNKKTIYDKVCWIRECAVKPDGDPAEREKKRQLLINRGRAEREYVEKSVSEKFFPDAEPGDISFDCIDNLLKSHIKIVGEDVLRNELFDMYNDYMARIEYSVGLDRQIEKAERKLRLLKERRDKAYVTAMDEGTDHA